MRPSRSVTAIVASRRRCAAAPAVRATICWTSSRVRRCCAWADDAGSATERSRPQRACGFVILAPFGASAGVALPLQQLEHVLARERPRAAPAEHGDLVAGL